MTAWTRTTKFDARAVALADRHYSRQTRGSSQFMPPGKTFVLITPDGKAVWGACANKDPRGRLRLRCTIFRNEGPARSSDLIRHATVLTKEWASDHEIAAPLETEVDPRRVRAKRDPGRCFLRAGWIRIGLSKSHRHRGAIVLAAPGFERGEHHASARVVQSGAAGLEPVSSEQYTPRLGANGDA